MSFNTLEAIELYKKNAGNVSATCKALNVSRNFFYTYKKAHPKFAEALIEAQESLKDFAESQLFTLMNGGKTIYEESKDVILNGAIHTLKHTKFTKRPPDITAIIFYLKTQCKDRGYIERQEFITKEPHEPQSLKSEAEAQLYQEYLDKIEKLRNE